MNILFKCYRIKEEDKAEKHKYEEFLFVECYFQHEVKGNSGKVLLVCSDITCCDRIRVAIDESSPREETRVR